METKTVTIAIYTEYIELQQFLKLAGLISTGGEAKSFLLDSEIRVNGESENRRKKKLRDGDVVEVNGLTYEIKAVCT